MQHVRPAIALLALALSGVSSALAAAGGQHSANSIGKHGKPQDRQPQVPSIAQGPLPPPSPVAPVTRRAFSAAPKRGRVQYRGAGPGGGAKFRPLIHDASLPLGSAIDASNGTVALTVARDAGGRPQVIVLAGGRFVVTQHGSGPITDVTLAGGDFAGCPRPGRGRAALAAAAHQRRRSRHSVVRQLWARDNHGQFMSYGLTSVATVRGTVWLTQDRCDGTLTRVVRGRVVVNDAVRHGTVVVKAGHAYLARRRR